MANSMIPYSFIPGTKARANEVNANFLALAEQIQQNKNTSSQNVEEIKETLDTKADKTDLITEFTIEESDTDLNDYKTKGTYIFTSLYTPLNIPTGESGILTVNGDENSAIQQLWFSDDNQIFTRTFKDSEWGEWYTPNGKLSLESYGYLQMPNGLLLQWGLAQGSVVTYPLAFKKFACPVFSKNGWGLTFERSDTGYAEQSLTGFSIGSAGVFANLNWIAIGY